MAEEQQGQEKTEEATPRRLEKAREEGQVARSKELNSVAIVTFGAIAGLFLLPTLAGQVKTLGMNIFADAGNPNLSMTEVLADSLVQTLLAMLPFSLTMMAAGIAASVGVGGLLFSPKALQPKFERLSPIKGFGRMFSSRSLVELAKSVAKVVLIAGVAGLALYVTLDDLLVLGALPLESALSQGMVYVGVALLLIGLALVVVAAIDVPFQIAQHKKQLKMTKQEVKDELKDAEGKPEVKARIRQLQQQVAQRKMLEDLPTADVVITNPEHFSVAIRYDSELMMAPILVAKGVDNMAFTIREVAGEHDIPMVPAPLLARAIYYNTQAGHEIPESLYVAVAQVLAYVYQLAQYQRGEIRNQPQLSSLVNGLDVPEDMAQGPEGGDA